MSKSKYYVLVRDDETVVAAAAVPASDNEWPPVLKIRRKRYYALQSEDTFFFWDELRNDAGETVGYVFRLPESPTLRASDFVRQSKNVRIEHDEVFILLHPCRSPHRESVQGFGSAIYVSEDDHNECAIYMLDWSENPLAFCLESLER